MAITKIHNELFELLYEHFRLNPEFKFRPRKTNRSNRLEEGFWFLGNNEYLAVGFWTGDDWRTKLPNIAFMVNYEGHCWLHFSMTDEGRKFDFLLDQVFPSLGLNVREKEFRTDGGKLDVQFESKNLQDSLFEFLTKFWPIIDEIVRREEKSDYGIGIIENKTFIKDLNKIIEYKTRIERYEEELQNIRPSKISGFKISNYKSIKQLEFSSIPFKAQWVFLTGENGVGKSNILKALARTIGFRKLNANETNNINRFDCKIYTNSDTSIKLHFHRKANLKTGRVRPLLLGFAAYGPFRLNPIYGGLSSNQLKQARSKNGHSNTLFSNNAYLLDLESQFSEWYNSDNNQEFASRTYAIKEFLEGLLLNVGEVKFGMKVNDIPVTLFREKDGEDKLFDAVGIEKLSSGYMSILSMMSDLLVRLYRQQPDIDDPGELRGVVFIDEIDIHLHPKFQKHFVEQLTAAFPKVQFIVSTHSPIPLLGAPKDSVICVVKRNLEKGTYIERIDDKIYLEELLPNTILTSPIFGMDNISNENREKGTFVRTEKTFAEVEFVNKLEGKIQEFITDEREKELIERFENKRK
ncbi:putative AbiEii toxin of type IV toxin-antitoxin system [Winogradskyella wandonensis]|uniref:Putative AbiEii toxin of type IV toxin-antitoxin system n=1 Tax=Winogradskyella wandonensis TaxID=1442586 RepID=A0A4R1KQA5_9FLAO|nr:AAA family ATPase [Winogradskyella wandonensis]TCK67245.1 putative AbiEii toxin of type IV toxin-antitoxin system [Winogradskyella wandonensis]